MNNKLSPLTKTSYALGNLGYGSVCQNMNSFLMFFGTSVLGISGTLVGLLTAIAALWDGVSDPIVGYFCDHSPNKGLGKRQNYLFFASFGIALFNIVVWVTPQSFPIWAKFFWLLISLLLLETFLTMFSTPYIAHGIDMAPDYNEQSSVQGYKTVTFILGMIVPSVMMLLFMPAEGVEQAQFQQSNYVNIALLTSFITLVCGLICVFGTYRTSRKLIFNEFTKEQKKKESFLKIIHDFFLALKKANCGCVIIGYSVALISSAFLISVGMHLFTYSYHFSSIQISILMLILFASAIISQPAWVFLANRIDKKPTLNFSLILLLFAIGITAISFIFREFLDNSILFAFVSLCLFICGFGTGALYSLPISMFADVITLERIKTGENRSGTYSGFMTLAFNIANSATLFLIGVLLDIIKFDSTQPVQALSVQNGLGILVFFGCSLAIALSLLIFSKYSIKRADILKAQMIENQPKSFNQSRK